MTTVTRTELYAAPELEAGISSMEDAGWAVRSIVPASVRHRGHHYHASGVVDIVETISKVIVVFERET